MIIFCIPCIAWYCHAFFRSENKMIPFLRENWELNRTKITENYSIRNFLKFAGSQQYSLSFSITRDLSLHMTINSFDYRKSSEDKIVFRNERVFMSEIQRFSNKLEVEKVFPKESRRFKISKHFFELKNIIPYFSTTTATSSSSYSQNIIEII